MTRRKHRQLVSFAFKLGLVDHSKGGKCMFAGCSILGEDKLIDVQPSGDQEPKCLRQFATVTAMIFKLRT